MADYPPPSNPGYPPQPYPPQQQPYPPPGAPPPQAYPPQPEYPPQYPPPQPQAYPQYPPPQQPPPVSRDTATTNVVVVTQQPTAAPVGPIVFRTTPVIVTDSKGQQVQTVLQYRSGPMTWLVCCLICWLTGLCCIALIPFCINDLKDVYHITPTDGKVVGVYKRC